MSTVLFSTSSLWNCGDDFIRDGVLDLLSLRREVRQIWWNRGFGISERYANDPRVNLPLTDYFIVAGTPRWIFNNEKIYRHCLRHEIPMALIGVGTAEFVGRSGYDLMRKVAASGLCEVALARDDHAYEKLRSLGFDQTTLMLDPCFFKKPLNSSVRDVSIVGWREQYGLDGDPRLPLRYPLYVARELLRRKVWQRKKAGVARGLYDRLMLECFRSLPEPRVATVHDNREVRAAERLFGADSVYYATDARLFFELYSRARTYVGSRIHGAIPALIHGATVQLIYTTSKSSVLNAASRILAGHSGDLARAIGVRNLHEQGAARSSATPTPFRLDDLRTAIETERQRVRGVLRHLPVLGSLMDDSR